MTNQNNAAQSVLTDDQIEALAKKHIAPHADRLDAIMTNPVRYQQTEQFRRVKALIVDVLSALRAPVADERDRNATISRVVGLCNRIPGATTWNAAEFMYDEMHRRAAPATGERQAVAYLDLGAGGYMDVGTDLTDEQLAALPKGRHMLAIIGTHGVDGYTPASAPVAGEAQPVAECERCGLAPEDHTESHWCDNQSFRLGDTVQLGAAPQASTVDGLPAWWERFMNELTLRSEDEVRNDLPGILEICALDAIASAAPQASEAVAYLGDNVAARLDNMADSQPPGSQAQSDLYAAATIWRKHIAHRATPQDSDYEVVGEVAFSYDGEKVGAFYGDAPPIETLLYIASAQPAQKEQSE